MSRKNTEERASISTRLEALGTETLQALTNSTDLAERGFTQMSLSVFPAMSEGESDEVLALLATLVRPLRELEQELKRLGFRQE